jgi:hypothetical protein
LLRRDVFIWTSVVLFLNQFAAKIFEAPSESLEQLITEAGAISIFQYIAWFAIFRLLIGSDPGPRARWWDVLVTVPLCFLVFLPTARSIWVAAVGVAFYGGLFNRGDPRLRAAGIVLAALSVQAFWGHVFFRLVAFPLLCAETAVVGTILQVIRAGTVWQDNVITGLNGYGIVILNQCSSFHNLSLAMLCWVTISKLRHHNWRLSDFLIGGVVGLTMILWNVARLCVMAWNIDLYTYLHSGNGAEIFALSASLSVFLISLYGSRSVGQQA